MLQADFLNVESTVTMIPGCHQAFCPYSFECRGTEKRLGWLFGLDKRGIRRGMAFRKVETFSDETQPTFRSASWHPTSNCRASSKVN